MTGLTYIAVALLLHIQTSYAVQQTAGSECSTEGMRKAAVDEALATLNCDNYTCALKKVLTTGSATTCADIFNNNKSAPSGYYWLKSDNGSEVNVYCDMTLTCKGVGGGWMQVVKLDMTNNSTQCPPGTRLRTDLPIRLCGNSLPASGCSSTVFDIHGIEYGQVCGKIIGYQDQTPDAFEQSASTTIDSYYVDGISLTHGNNPREHIWTFAAAPDEVGEYGGRRLYCPCTNINLPQYASQPPSFVGNDYFCDTASEHRFQHIFYPDDPLWNGAGCGPDNTCCSLNNPPWFLKQLPSSTNDDIEMRICRDAIPQDEDTPIETVELYVR